MFLYLAHPATIALRRHWKFVCALRQSLQKPLWADAHIRSEIANRKAPTTGSLPARLEVLRDVA
jgi:hypothetical protein